MQGRKKMTNIIDNKTDKIFSTIYPDPQKETIILLHGGPGFPDDLEEVAEFLKSSFQIITFHQRGTRKSPCLSGDYSMSAYISDIDIVAKFYGLSKFHLLGHSWGGLYAQIYADKNGDRLLSLFLCSPGSGTGVQWRQTENEVMHFNRSKCTTWQWSKMGMNNLAGMLGSDKGYQKLFRQVLKNYNSDFGGSNNSGPGLDNIRAEPVNRSRPEILKYPLLAKQENPNFRISIVYGDQDIYQTSKDYVIDRHPTAEKSTIKNCGHLPWLHNPEDFKKILLKHYE